MFISNQTYHVLIIVEPCLLRPDDHLQLTTCAIVCGELPLPQNLAYRVLVRPLLKYACQVWSPHTAHDICLIEVVQCRAARWACGNQWNLLSRRWSKLSDDCLDALHWPTLGSHRDYLSLSMLYDILNKEHLFFIVTIPIKSTSFTRVHELAIVPLQSSINCMLSVLILCKYCAISYTLHEICSLLLLEGEIETVAANSNICPQIS